MKKIVSILISLAMLLSMSVLPATAETVSQNTAAMNFAVQLFQNSMGGEGNVTISPLSVMYALAMTMNGAEGETLAQMENAVGMSRDEFNEFLPTYLAHLAKDDGPLNSANSIWIKDDGEFSVNEEFVSMNSGLYDAEINAWVSDATEGRITEILKAIPADAVMYLINALAFSSEWEIAYTDEDIAEDIFTAADGTQQNVNMMYAAESIYIEDGSATGFMKLYKGQNYAFVALLPNEGITVDDYVQSLTGESVTGMLQNAYYLDVDTWIPQFTMEYSAEMKDMLAAMGITDAFDPELADLSGIGDELYISGVTHKTQITVDAQGTEAAAATNVGIMTMGMPPMEDPKEVRLDRPFVYMIIDVEKQLPVFIGAVETID